MRLATCTGTGELHGAHRGPRPPAASFHNHVTITLTFTWLHNQLLDLHTGMLLRSKGGC